MDRRGTAFFLLILGLFLAALPARAWDVRRDAPVGDFLEFHRHFSAASYFYPRHGAAPLGLVGFNVYADAAVDQDFDDHPYADTVIDDDLTGGLLAVGRVGARKGLPAGIDIGLSYGQAIDSDIDLLSGELQWAIVKGGALTPAVGLRLTGTRSMGSDAYQLDQYGAELMLSKGFAVLTPYVGIGTVYSRGTLDRVLGPDLEESDTRGVIYGGLTLNLLLPKITVEVEKAEVVQWAARVSIGL